MKKDKEKGSRGKMKRVKGEINLMALLAAVPNAISGGGVLSEYQTDLRNTNVLQGWI